MKRVIGLFALAATLAVIGACSKGSSGTVSPEAIGVKECDDYIAKMQTCFAKDSNVKMMSEPMLAASKDAWVQAAKDPNAKAGLATTCKKMLDGFAGANPKCN